MRNGADKKFMITEVRICYVLLLALLFNLLMFSKPPQEDSLQFNYKKLDPFLGILLQNYENNKRASKSFKPFFGIETSYADENDIKYINVIIEFSGGTDAEDFVPFEGLIKGAVVGNMMTAKATPKAIKILSQMNNVKAIEMARKVKLLNDIAHSTSCFIPGSQLVRVPCSNISSDNCPCRNGSNGYCLRMLFSTMGNSDINIQVIPSSLDRTDLSRINAEIRLGNCNGQVARTLPDFNTEFGIRTLSKDFAFPYRNNSRGTHCINFNIASNGPPSYNIVISGDIGINFCGQQGGVRLGTGAKTARISEDPNTLPLAIIGIIDTGIDWCHQDFRNPDGTTRILFLLDKSLNKEDKSLNKEYTSMDINVALSRGCDTSIVQSKDINGHGTHVAGIAAGNGASMQNRLFAGTDPDSKLIVVNLGPGGSTTKDIVDAIRDIFLKGDLIDKNMPVVVNISLGSLISSLDGESLADKMITKLARPNKIIVAAAGNAGALPQFFGTTNRIFKRFSQGEEISVTVLRSFIIVYADKKEDFSVSCSEGSCRVYQGFPSEDYRREFSSPPSFIIEVESGYATLKIKRTGNQGSGILEAYGQTLEGQGGPFALLYNESQMCPYSEGGECLLDLDELGSGIKKTVNSPATALGVIAVGAYTGKYLVSYNVDPAVDPFRTREYLGNIAIFSSRGPTRDGRLKPDIVSPGLYVMSAKSRWSDTQDEMCNRGYCDASRKYVAEQGTSMGAPSAAGAISILARTCKKRFGNSCKLWPRPLLQNTATLPSQSSPNNVWGYGLLNITGNDIDGAKEKMTSNKDFPKINSFTIGNDCKKNMVETPKRCVSLQKQKCSNPPCRRSRICEPCTVPKECVLNSCEKPVTCSPNSPFDTCITDISCVSQSCTIYGENWYEKCSRTCTEEEICVVENDCIISNCSPVVKLPEGCTINVNQEVTLSVDAYDSDGIYEYLWEPYGNGIDDITCSIFNSSTCKEGKVGSSIKWTYTQAGLYKPRVSVVDRWGLVSTKEISLIVIGDSKLLTPTLINVTNTTDTIEIQWKDNSNAEDVYLVERNFVGSSLDVEKSFLCDMNTEALINSKKNNSFTFRCGNKEEPDTLVADRIYTYKISPCKKDFFDIPYVCGNPLVVSNNSIISRPPNPPTLRAVLPTSWNTISVIWQDNSNNEANFLIYRNEQLIKVLPSNTTSYIDDSVDAGVEYRYKVVAKNSKGEGASVEMPVIIPKTLPLAPTGLVARPFLGRYILVSWNDTAINESSFVVERKRSDKTDFVVIATLKANTTMFQDSQDSETTDGKISTQYSYTYRVKAVNPIGSSPYSNEATAMLTGGGGGGGNPPGGIIIPNSCGIYTAVINPTMGNAPLDVTVLLDSLSDITREQDLNNIIRVDVDMDYDGRLEFSIRSTLIPIRYNLPGIFYLKVKVVHVSGCEDIIVEKISVGGFFSIPNEQQSITTQSGGGGGGCFIVSVVYGSSSAPEVDTFRKLKDTTIIKTRLGRKFIDLYYEYGPLFAEKIKRNKVVKLFTSIFIKILQKYIHYIVLGKHNILFGVLLFLLLFYLYYGKSRR